MRTLTTSLIVFLFLVVGNSQDVFIDITTTSGLLDTTGGQGASVGDFNNDGYDDIYVTFPNGKNHLYQNRGNGTFIELADSLGVALEEDTESKAAVWGDVNNDGWTDLYVANRAVQDRLFLNQEGTGFQEISFQAGIIQLGNPLAANMTDINNDGYLDIYISNFMLENIMYLNNGDLTFTNYTFQAGALDNGLAMGTVCFDFDNDGDQDIYLVHDGYDPNFMYRNDGTGIFTEVGASIGVNTESFGMGVDVGDVNNDGFLDIYIANLGPNFLLLNNANGTYSDISETANIGDSGMGWGCNLFDYDNDGLDDIYVANLHAFAPKPNVLYKNQGDLTFTIEETNSPISDQEDSYGSAVFDLDLDGHLDMVVTTKGAGERTKLYQNVERSKNWIGFKLIGTISNFSAIGAKVELIDNLGQLHYTELVAGQSWASQSTSLVHFGLGDAESIESLTVTWPSGLEQVIDDDLMNGYFTIFEGGDVFDGVVYEPITTSTQETTADAFPMQVFPNPNDGVFQVQFHTPSSGAALVEVFDVLGQQIFTTKIEGVGPGIQTIPVAVLEQTTDKVLVVRVTSGSASVSKRVLIGGA